MAPPDARADILKLQDLHFGNLIILNNSEPHIFVLNADGTTTPSEHIFVMDTYQGDGAKPAPARFKIDALKEHSQISVVAENIKLEAHSSDNYFWVKDIVVSDTHTDEQGDMSFSMGATLETSGNGMAYAEDVYEGVLPITVSY